MSEVDLHDLLDTIYHTLLLEPAGAFINALWVVVEEEAADPVVVGWIADYLQR